MEEIQFQPIKITPIPSNAFHQLPSLNSHKSNRITSDDIQLVESEIKKIVKMKQQFTPLLDKLRKSKNQAASSIKALNDQAQQLKKKIQDYQKQFQASKQGTIKRQIERSKKQYISKWQQRITTASTVNIKPFLDVDLDDRKSIANQLFKWIVVGLYGQTQAKFYWPNFKEQIFQKDDGKDFKERLGKINAATAKQQQILKMKDFLNKFEDIFASQELQGNQEVKSQSQKFKIIAKLFIQCHQLAKKTLDLQASIDTCKQASLKKDQQALKWKSREQALQQRIQVYNQYLKTLSSTQKQLQKKQINYGKKQKLAKEISSKLKKGQQIDEEVFQKFGEN